MIEIRDITKTYKTGDLVQRALDGAVHDYRQQKVKEVSILGKETTLILRKRRYVCKSCCKRFPEKNDLLSRYARMTARLTNQICGKLENEYSLPDT